MSPFPTRLSLAASLIVAACTIASPAHAQGWAESWFDNVTYTSPGSFEDQTRGYVTAGGMSGRVDVHNDYLMSITLPKVKAGCGGIDMFLGGMSFLDPDYLVQKLGTSRRLPVSPRNARRENGQHHLEDGGGDQLPQFDPGQ